MVGGNGSPQDLLTLIFRLILRGPGGDVSRNPLSIDIFCGDNVAGDARWISHHDVADPYGGFGFTIFDGLHDIRDALQGDR